jgi:putative addiction module component (TIGR02574 family)
MEPVIDVVGSAGYTICMSPAYLDRLSVTDRLALIEAIWESLDKEEDIPLSRDQRELIRERVREFRTNPQPGTPVEQAIAEVRAARP